MEKEVKKYENSLLLKRVRIKNMKLIIHDLSKEDFNNISENLNEEDIIICKGKRINKCIRCFGF